MTGNQVTNLFGAQNTTWMSSKQPAGKTDSLDFQSFMKNSEDNLKSVEVKTTDIKKKPDVNEKNEIKENVENTGKKTVREEKTENVTDKREPSDDDVTTVKEAVEKIREAVKEAFGITDEQLAEALDNLGMVVMALLVPENITDIAVEISGEESSIGLVTNEDLYNTVKDIISTVEETASEMFEKIGVSPEEFNEAIAEVNANVGETDEEVSAVTTQPTEIKNDKSAVKKEDDKKPLEEKIVLENNAPKAETKNFSVQTKNEGTADEKFDAEESKLTKDEVNEPEVKETYVSFVQNLIDKTQEALNSKEVTANYSTEETRQLMDQVTENIKVQINLDTTEISIKLHPESLGNVNVKVTANSEGTMTAQFTAQNESVKAVLEAQTVVLREALEEKGITIEAVEVMVASHEFNEDLSNREDRNDNNSGRKSSTRRISLEALEEQEELTEEENLQKEMMQQNGNTVDYTA